MAKKVLLLTERSQGTSATTAEQLIIKPIQDLVAKAGTKADTTGTGAELTSSGSSQSSLTFKELTENGYMPGHRSASGNADMDAIRDAYFSVPSEVEVHGSKFTVLSARADRVVAALRQQGKLDNVVNLQMGTSFGVGGALKELNGLTNLRTLGLGYTDITDADLATLQNLPNLETLGLGGTKITANGLRKLEALPSIRKIDLKRIKSLKGPDLAQLSGLPKLEDLVIEGTQTTDAELRQVLPDLPSVKKVDATYTSVTGDGFVSSLRGRTNPELTIRYDGPLYSKRNLHIGSGRDVRADG